MPPLVVFGRDLLAAKPPAVAMSRVASPAAAAHGRPKSLHHCLHGGCIAELIRVELSHTRRAVDRWYSLQVSAVR